MPSLSLVLSFGLVISVLLSFFQGDRNDAPHSLDRSHNHLDASTMQLFSMFPYISIAKWHFHAVQCTCSAFISSPAFYSSKLNLRRE